MPSNSIDHNHEPTQALPNGLAVFKAQPLPLLMGGLFEFFSWGAIYFLFVKSSQLAYGGFAMVGMWVVTLLISAFLFVTHCWIRHNSLQVQLKSISETPDIFEAVYSEQLPKPFIQWRLYYLGVHMATAIVAMLPGFFISFIASSLNSDVLALLGQMLSGILSFVLFTATQMALFFGDRLVVFSEFDPQTALKQSFQLSLKHKLPVFMFLFVGGALRIIGALFCGIGLPIVEIMLDTSLTKAFQESQAELERIRS